MDGARTGPYARSGRAHGRTRDPMRPIRLSFRFLHVALVVFGAFFGYLFARITSGGGGDETRDRLRGEHLARLLERLGATYIKFGQILSTRPDILPQGIIDGLSKLQDRVAPASFEAVDRVLKSELGEDGERSLGRIEKVPVAAASVAQVHRATRPDGTVVAVKIQRPDVEGQVDRDLTLLMIGARFLNLFPTVRLLSLPGAVERFADAMKKQLDFRNEAENNRRFARNFADVPHLAVPKLVDELCTRRVLVMEFVDGVRATEPEKVGGDRKALAIAGFEAMLRMVFADGFVHADLHPGNILLTPDDRVVLIDLGLVAEIPDDMRRPWVETFMALSVRDGAGAARLFYGHAPSVGSLDFPSFARDVEAEFEKLNGKVLGELEASRVLSDMMIVLRKHRIQIDPVFTVVNIAMLVAEGLGKQLDPQLDIVPLATPYIANALVASPPGRPMLREVPAVA